MASAQERAQIGRITKALERVAGRLVTKITLDVDANLRESTPVDTGWARANWVPAIGSPYIADLSGIDPSSEHQAVASAQGRASAGQAAVLGYKLGPRVFVTNNVPYISRLNGGSSAQAPAGFVQRAISKALTQDIRSFRG